MKTVLMFLAMAFFFIGCGAMPEEDVTSTTWRGDSSQTNNDENENKSKGDTGENPENKAVTRSLAIVTEYARTLNTSEMSESPEIGLGMTYVCKLLKDYSLQCNGIDGSKEVSENLAGMTDLVAGENQTCGLLENQNVLCWDNLILMNDEITVNEVEAEAGMFVFDCLFVFMFLCFECKYFINSGTIGYR